MKWKAYRGQNTKRPLADVHQRKLTWTKLPVRCASAGFRFRSTFRCACVWCAQVCAPTYYSTHCVCHVKQCSFVCKCEWVSVSTLWLLRAFALDRISVEKRWNVRFCRQPEARRELLLRSLLLLNTRSALCRSVALSIVLPSDFAPQNTNKGKTKKMTTCVCVLILFEEVGVTEFTRSLTMRLLLKMLSSAL